MIRAHVERWSAWAPGLPDAAAWEGWARRPAPLADGSAPDARFLPPLLRRRCGPLARIALTVASECCSEPQRAEVGTVFASRHGNINESIALLEHLARSEPLSPTRFSHTVHNAQAGLFSIAAGNRRPSSSLAGCADTFACGWIEALTFLARTPERPVLLVMADVPLAEAFAGLVDEPAAAYGLALLLASHGRGPSLALALAGDGDEAPRAWPDACEFLRWLLAGEGPLCLGTGPRRFVWERQEASAHA